MSLRFGELRESVYRANMDLAASGLVMGTFGNVSGVDRAAGVFSIKPSGVPYGDLRPEHMVPISLQTGEVIDSTLRPSSDAPTHLELYRAFPCGGIAHTHSEFATTLAQARLPIRCLGTTHADYFCEDVPVTRPMRRDEVAQDYERNTGVVIVETFRTKALDPMNMPGVLVANHGPFAWGTDAFDAVEHARVLEYIARLEWRILSAAPQVARPDQFLIDKHYQRKHGPQAYYGQKKKG
ncbi:MAG TPA: L-ribulose-5-phosphate 4-epimerase AraD [Vicinamibacterales bacterium]|nr:L-ribulose-5-phosphate 4-epimerase AraD [Vicinamibacterales bacterium]